MSEARERSFNSPTHHYCSMESRENITAHSQPNPSKAPDKKFYECPLCVDTFEQFSQLKRHLLTVHPRRDMIMELVKNRYEKSSVEERNSDEMPSTNFDTSQKHFQQSCFRPSLNNGCAGGSGKLDWQQPSEMTAECFQCQSTKTILKQPDGPSEQHRMDCEAVSMGIGERNPSPREPSLSACLSHCSITQGCIGNEIK